MKKILRFFGLYKISKKQKNKCKLKRCILRCYKHYLIDKYSYICKYKPNISILQNIYDSVFPILTQYCNNNNISIEIDSERCKKHGAIGLHILYETKNAKIILTDYCDKKFSSLYVLCHEIGHNLLYAHNKKQSELKADLISYLYLKNKIDNKYILYSLFILSDISNKLKKQNKKELISDYLKLKKLKNNNQTVVNDYFYLKDDNETLKIIHNIFKIRTRILKYDHKHKI